MWSNGGCKVDVSMCSDGVRWMCQCGMMVSVKWMCQCGVMVGVRWMCQCGVRWMWSDSGCKVDVSMWSDGVLVLSVHHCMCQCYMLVPSVNVCQC